MDFVIFVKSCAADRKRGLHEAIRETWGGWSELADIRFVLGRGVENPLADELVFDADDGWDFLWQKTAVANLWAVQHTYDWAFHACTDTYVVIPRLIALARALDKPYVGCAVPGGHMSGGAGYLLGWDAMMRLAVQRWYPDFEDKEVYELLDGGTGVIQPTSLPVFRGAEPWPWDKDTVSIHLGTARGSVTPSQIRACDRRFIEAFGDES